MNGVWGKERLGNGIWRRVAASMRQYTGVCSHDARLGVLTFGIGVRLHFLRTLQERWHLVHFVPSRRDQYVTSILAVSRQRPESDRGEYRKLTCIQRTASQSLPNYTIFASFPEHPYTYIPLTFQATASILPSISALPLLGPSPPACIVPTIITRPRPPIGKTHPALRHAASLLPHVTLPANYTCCSACHRQSLRRTSASGGYVNGDCGVHFAT
jgi:hypothetical protein